MSLQSCGLIPSRDTVMITGPQWIPLGYFQRFYEEPIRQAFEEDAFFAVGAAEGVDMFAQNLLFQLCQEKNRFNRVSVYNKGEKDGRVCDKFILKNGFESYPDRDIVMACSSNKTIAFLPLYGGSVSGSVVPVLNKTFCNSNEVLAVLRKHSEPWDERVIKEYIVPLYEKLYPVRENA